MLVGSAIGFSLAVQSCGHDDAVEAEAWDEPEPVDVVDPRTGLEWSRESGQAMSWRQAQDHCDLLNPYGSWRLPSRADLESLRSDDGDHLRPQFQRHDSRASHLMSGEFVDGTVGEPWVINTWNGHVFNGGGYSAHVRCVRGPR